MRSQPLEPCELVVEFRAGLRIAVRQIDAGDDDAVDGGFDIARLVVVAIAGQLGPDQHRFGLARQDGDAVPGLLAAPDRAVAGLVDGAERKVLVGRLQLLQANDVGLCLLQPSQQVRQPPIDIVDVERGDLHTPARALSVPIELERKGLCFLIFCARCSSREPVSTSLENAPGRQAGIGDVGSVAAAPPL